MVLFRKTDCIPRIDMKKTGGNIEAQLRCARISVRKMQKMLGLSCPQSIYRWLSGQSLPSLDHLFRMSRILGCTMEELIAEEETGEGSLHNM